MERGMGRAGMAFSAFAVAAGAIMYWAVTSHGTGFRISTVGVILMIVGGVGFVASGIIFAVSRHPDASRDRTFDREATDAQGGQTTTMHEEVHH